MLFNVPHRRECKVSYHYRTRTRRSIKQRIRSSLAYMLLRDRNGNEVSDTGGWVTWVVDGDGNIWRTAPLIKPKERRVLSFRAAAMATTLHCAKAAWSASYTSYRREREREKDRERERGKGGEERREERECDLVKRALARKFAPIPFHSHVRDTVQPGLLLQKRAKPT